MSPKVGRRCLDAISSRRAAAAVRCGRSAGVAESRIGLRVSRRSSPSSRGTSTVGSSPSASASAKAPATSLTTPAGTPASQQRARPTRRRAARARPRSSAARERLAVRDAGRGWWRTAGRSPSSGEPSTSHSAANWLSLPTASTRSPLARCANSSYGAMLGCALPIRPRHDAGERERRALVDERRQQRGQQVDLDALALAGARRGGAARRGCRRSRTGRRARRRARRRPSAARRRARR